MRLILRGGSDVLSSNMALTHILQDTLADHGFPKHAIQYINSTDRKHVSEMLRLYEYIDMIIPRGGNGLHVFCRENSSIPVITGGIGVCHIFVDKSARLDKTLPVLINAKTQRPAVCNSMETLLAHQEVATALLPRVVDELGALRRSAFTPSLALLRFSGSGSKSYPPPPMILIRNGTISH